MCCNITVTSSTKKAADTLFLVEIVKCYEISESTSANRLAFKPCNFAVVISRQRWWYFVMVGGSRRSDKEFHCGFIQRIKHLTAPSPAALRNICAGTSLSTTIMKPNATIEAANISISTGPETARDLVAALYAH